MNMTVYPEIESWDELYPSEIFILLGENETIDNAESVLKMANIGSTIYIGVTPLNTAIVKKIGESNGLFGYTESNLVLIGTVKSE